MKSRNIALAGLGAVVLIALFMANRPSEKNATTGPIVATTATTPVATPAPAPAVPVPAVQPQEKPVPHFHARLEDALPLPKILPASQFRIPVVARAYRIAARIPEVLAQQPCYCWCDKMGHGSLVDCFATSHGAG